MRQHLITLLAVITLLSQWGWLEHDYHEHDAGQVCEVCVSAAGHVAVIPDTPQLPPLHGSETPFTPSSTSFSAAAPRFYTARAPPRFL
ncbi:MAG: hypothetical protein OQK94_08890 [Gammaproteobacteria bacterium]|nr:hypothetical protein [Gammaproteobacteria bacterium]MCW8841748.1 hypothetical protein [Gammaproteobacteria bacterium]MCW8958137.1 hypothetical protein [Gammaproteobacteria bacterium]MCW8972893.1 hypothetical protein [Gammaproteobacteria bacterium]MCW8991692.1 hypothetical protein [Gammaproteobacteria bacterium]